MSKGETGESRRNFLKLAATAPAAAGAMALGGAAEAAQPAATAGEGLRDTEHTRKFFEAARF